MALETGTYISDLVTSNPPQSDSLTQAAGHLRLLKSTIKATFPNVTGAISATHTNLDGAATQYARNGFVPAGVVSAYAGSSAPTGWLLCYGQSVLRADYADLFTAIGTTYGSADGTHFNLPDLRERHIIGKANMGGSDAGLISSDFLVTTTLGATYDGDFGNNAYGSDYYNFSLTSGQIPSHTHSFSGSVSVSGSTGSGGADHYHSFSGSTSSDGSHSHSYTRVNNTGSCNAGPDRNAYTSTTGDNTGSSGSHNHSFSGSTGFSSGYLHTHSFSGSGSVSGTTGASGSGTSIWIGVLTPCIILNYIIKT